MSEQRYKIKQGGGKFGTLNEITAWEGRVFLSLSIDENESKRATKQASKQQGDGTLDEAHGGGGSAVLAHQRHSTHYAVVSMLASSVGDGLWLLPPACCACVT